MTPPIDPVEETSIEKDARMVREALDYELRCEIAHVHTDAPEVGPHLRTALASLDALESELTLEKQRGEAYRAALRWIAANDVDPIDANRIAQLEAMIERAREALRISQGDSE